MIRFFLLLQDFFNITCCFQYFERFLSIINVIFFISAGCPQKNSFFSDFYKFFFRFFTSFFQYYRVFFIFTCFFFNITGFFFSVLLFFFFNITACFQCFYRLPSILIVTFIIFLGYSQDYRFFSVFLQVHFNFFTSYFQNFTGSFFWISQVFIQYYRLFSLVL